MAGGERFGEAVVLKRTTGARRGGRRSGRSKSQVLGGSVSGTVHLRRRQIVSLCLFCFFLLLRCSLYFVLLFRCFLSRVSRKKLRGSYGFVVGFRRNVSAKKPFRFSESLLLGQP